MSPLFSTLSRRTLLSLFLQSHGLRDPLTAIRWGSHRLKKEKMLTPAQHDYLVDEIFANSKVLTTMVESMVLLAEVENGLHKKNQQEVCLRSLLSSLTAEFSHLKGNAWKVQSPHLHVRSDRRILEALLRSL